ncbi:MAG: DUF4382 domain-containing protein, partial [Planctomycetota bacterium]
MLLVAACGSSGVTKTAGAASGTVGFVTGDSPIDGLSSVSLTITAVTLKRADGTFTANLLSSPRTFNFLGLARRQAILSQSELPADTYREISVTVDPNSVSAGDLNGAVVPVAVASGTDSDGFSGSGSSRLKVVEGKFKTVSIDLDLANSLDNDPNVPGGLILDLRIRGRQETADVELDSFRGEVISVNRAGSSFILKVEDDDAPNDSFGRATVKVQDGDFLADAQGVSLATADAFLAALSPGTEVEGKGSMSPSGGIDASILRIEDDLEFRVKLKGRIDAIDNVAGTFDLLLKEIDKGRDLAQPVLDNLGDPGVLTISFQPNTPVIGEEGGNPLTPASLLPGLEVAVRLASIQAPMPFPAAAIEVDEVEIGYEGSITDIAGLPISFQITLDPEDPAVVNGLVTGPVTVDLSGIPAPGISLDVNGSPDLAALDLLINLGISVEGSLAGDPSAATLTPSRVEVEPGELEGIVSAVNSAASTLTVDVIESEDPFGGSSLGSVVTLQVPAAALLEGQNGGVTMADIASMFNNLQAGETR